MVRGLGVPVDQKQVAPAAGPEAGGVSVLFNALSVFIDLGPLIVLMVIPDWKKAKNFFTFQGFVLGAIINLMLLVHVLFDLKEEHLDVLFVAAVGFCFGTVYTFLLLGHRVVTNERARNARYLMMAVLLSFLIACYAVLSGIFQKYKAEGYAINGALFIAVAILNAVTLYPILICKPFPDEETKLYTLGMCIFNTVDAAFFVSYAVSLGSLDTALSVVSLITLACGLIQLFAMVILLLRNGLRKIGAFFRSLGDSCCGLCQLIALMFDLFVGHERTD